MACRLCAIATKEGRIAKPAMFNMNASHEPAHAGLKKFTGQVPSLALRQVFYVASQPPLPCRSPGGTMRRRLRKTFAIL